MLDVRTDLKGQIDRMTDEEVRGLQEYMATYPDPVAAAFRNAPYCDKPLSEELLRSLEEDMLLEENGDMGIPHEEVMRELGLD